MKKVKKNRELRWHKLDNTANVFPVVSGKNLSNVFRLSVELEEKVDKIIPLILVALALAV